MKIKLFILLFLSTTIMSYSQEGETNITSQKGKLTVGVYSGFQYNTNAFISTNDENFTYTERNEGFAYGANVGYFLAKRFRPRLSIGYNSSSFFANWKQTSNIYKTKVKLQKFEIDLNFDYLLLNKGKFQLFASVGAISEYLASVKYKNYEEDGDTNTNNYDEIEEPYPTSNFGANVSFIAKIKVLDNMSLNINPGYNYYFKEFSELDSDAYTRISANIGLEWTF